MNRFKTLAVLSAFALLLSTGGTAPALAADTPRTGDPNAALRKTSAPKNPLAELEKVQKVNNELAVQHFTEAIRKNAKDADAYAKRAKAYSGLKDYVRAMQDYDKAVELDPNLASGYVGRAVARYMMKDYDGSWADVHKAETLGGQFWPSFMDALKASSGKDS